MVKIWWNCSAVIDNALQTEFLKETLLQLYGIAVGTTKNTIHGWIQVPQVFSLNYDMTLWVVWLDIFETLEDIEREPVCSFTPPYRCISTQGKTGFWQLIHLTYRVLFKWSSTFRRKRRKSGANTVADNIPWNTPFKLISTVPERSSQNKNFHPISFFSYIILIYNNTYTYTNRHKL